MIALGSSPAWLRVSQKCTAARDSSLLLSFYRCMTCAVVWELPSPTTVPVALYPELSLIHFSHISSVWAAVRRSQMTQSLKEKKPYDHLNTCKRRRIECPSLKIRGKAKTPTLRTATRHCSRDPSQCNKRRQRNKMHASWKATSKTIFIGAMIPT